VTSPSRSGVFQQATDRRVEQFTESVRYDRRLCTHDVAGSLAHARMLAHVGILTEDELRQIEAALVDIRDQLEDGRLPWRPELEDVHMHVEQALIDRLGDVGRKLHTGRSRNDQVATDLRLWAREAIDRLDAAIEQLQRAFVERCDHDEDVVLPAYTHLQRAQPVLAPHYWLAYCEKLQRDRGRLADCRRRLNVSSLGAAAAAGTSLPIDRHETARELGFEEVAANSLDVSSDRDFVIELCAALAITAVHLSGWAEEWILWTTAEFGLLTLPQQFCTGSSIMPQKVNPDVLELIRGRSARVIGNLQTVLVLVKGLPLAYNRDLQEDKPPLFDSVDTVLACLEIAAPLVAGARLNRESIARRLEAGYLDATTLMEHLIGRGLPQRTAHHLVGTLVAEASTRGVPLAQLPLEVIQQARPDLDAGVYQVLGVENAVQAFVSYGSTAPREVARQVDRWKDRLRM
jgi:argininosuccinate lyase